MRVRGAPSQGYSRVMHGFQRDASHLERLPAHGCEPRVGGRVGVDEAARRNLRPLQGPFREAIFQRATRGDLMPRRRLRNRRGVSRYDAIPISTLALATPDRVSLGSRDVTRPH